MNTAKAGPEGHSLGTLNLRESKIQNWKYRENYCMESKVCNDVV